VKNAADVGNRQNYRRNKSDSKPKWAIPKGATTKPAPKRATPKRAQPCVPGRGNR
jgi:hypothetical protein